MSLELLATIKASQELLESPWQEVGLRELGSRKVDLPTRSNWLLQADAKLAWLRWWIGSIVPAGLQDDDELRRKANILKSTLHSLKTNFPLLNEAERHEYARCITETALSIDVRTPEKRSPLPVPIRQSLLDSAGRTPRCYLCGIRFPSSSIEYFLGNRSSYPESHSMIDFVFPRGLRPIDNTVVIDHVRPLHAGGMSTDLRNLRLACNYCNTIKSDALTLYSRGQYRREFGHPALGVVLVPNPYWVVRILGLDGKCACCGCTAIEGELYVATRDKSRYMNPANLEVYCRDDDPLKTLRWIHRDFFSQLA